MFYQTRENIGHERKESTGHLGHQYRHIKRNPFVEYVLLFVFAPLLSVRTKNTASRKSYILWCKVEEKSSKLLTWFVLSCVKTSFQRAQVKASCMCKISRKYIYRSFHMVSVHRSTPVSIFIRGNQVTF